MSIIAYETNRIYVLTNRWWALSFRMHTYVKLTGMFTLAKTGLTVMNIMLNVFVSLDETKLFRDS